MSVADAIFESPPGFSGTGETVSTNLNNPDLVPRAILFWRSEIHFLGVLGIMVLFVSILGQGSAGKALMMAEMPGPKLETGQSRVCCNDTHSLLNSSFPCPHSLVNKRMARE